MAVLISGRFPISEHRQLAAKTWRLSFTAPDLAAAIAPGQFVMIRLPERTDPLLGRAFALCDTLPDENGQPREVMIGLQVVGKMTRLLANARVGDTIEVWGPLGQPYPDYANLDCLLLVVGGIGYTPMVALAQRVLGTKGYAGMSPRREVRRVVCFYGARQADLLAGVEDLAASGVELNLATDDGSAGTRGLVTDLVRAFLAGQDQSQEQMRLVGCGPEPMLRALTAVATEYHVPCDVSLETPMACGTGLCFSCVTKVRLPDGSWDYRRVCVDGPTFDASSLMWE
jgi:dihydroorotate dehydrogenase electron transfer subunit